MNILNGVQNFLMLVNDNWTTIVVVIGLVIAIAKLLLFLHAKIPPCKFTRRYS